MKALKYMDEDTVVKKGIEVLIKELGPVDTVRFINLPKEKRLESIKRHRFWQKSLNKEVFLNDLFGSK